MQASNTKFRKGFLSVIVDVYFDLQCLALNNSTYSILIISEINKSHQIYKRNLPTEEKMQLFPCAIIPCHYI